MSSFFIKALKCICFIGNEKRIKFWIISVVIYINVILYLLYSINVTRDTTDETVNKWVADFYNNEDDNQLHYNIITTYYEKRKRWKTSNLGSMLFKNVPHQEFIRSDLSNKTFTVLIWKYWSWLRNRHLFNFGLHNKSPQQALEGCSVNNCVFSGDNEYLHSADAIVVHMQRKVFPRVLQRNYTQRWIFLSDESPVNTFSLAKTHIALSEMNNVFNWTMTYRSDSDVPVPYGRVLPLPEPVTIQLSDVNVILTSLVPHWSKKMFDRPAMVLISHCTGARMNFIHKLQTYIEVDVFGGCSEKVENKKKCPGHFKTDCMLPADYVFYLVLENSKCHQYITEKIFQHAYSKGAVPVIMGISLKDCEELLPPNSYLHIESYETVQDLAEHMKDIYGDRNKILHYHIWRKHFKIVNEHGYFKTNSYHLCRVCEALNFNDHGIKTYTEMDLDKFLNKELLCDLKYNKEV